MQIIEATGLDSLSCISEVSNMDDALKSFPNLSPEKVQCPHGEVDILFGMDNKLSSAKVGSEKLRFYSVFSLSQIGSETISFY